MSRSDDVLYPYPGPQLVRGGEHRPRAPTPYQAQLGAGARPELSLVAPVYNELDNLRPLVARIEEVFGGRLDYELVLVDDGSSDGSGERIRELARAHPRVRGVLFERNCG